MNPRALRKRLLLLEAEILRQRLAADWTAVRAEVRAATERAKSAGSVAASVAVGWMTIRRWFGRRTDSAPPRGIFLRSFDLAMLALPLWKTMRDQWKSEARTTAPTGRAAGGNG